MGDKHTNKAFPSLGAQPPWHFHHGDEKAIEVGESGSMGPGTSPISPGQWIPPGTEQPQNKGTPAELPVQTGAFLFR